MTTERAFSTAEIGIALAFAATIQVCLILLVALTESTIKIEPREEVAKQLVPIEVKPVLDPLPLLKLGGKRVKAKLPDMWTKKPPPVKRHKDTSAPSPKAEKEIEELPDTPLTPADAAPPPPDAKLAKEVDDIPKVDAAPPKELNVDEEGAPDGVEEGTETDPLKAFAVSQYRMKIIRWFKVRFRLPSDLPCEVLSTLRASVVANIGSDRTVTSYSVSKLSGNADFDARVKQTMEGIVGSNAQLPPPPPRYPDILDSAQFATFVGKGMPCVSGP